VPEDLPAQGSQLRPVSLQLLNDQGATLGEALRQHHVIRAEEPAALMDQRGTSVDESLRYCREISWVGHVRDDLLL
jgi:hypothetical protein